MTQPTPGPCYQCEIRDGGKATQQIVFCLLHVQAPALRDALKEAELALVAPQYRKESALTTIRALLKVCES